MVNDIFLVVIGAIFLASLIPVALGIMLVFSLFKNQAVRLLGVAVVLGLWFAVGYFQLTKGERSRKNERAVFVERFRPHEAYFQAVCRKAGVRVIATASNVSSVAFQAPRTNVTKNDLEDQRFRGDVYGEFDLPGPIGGEQSLVQTFLTKGEWEEQWYVPTRDEFLRYPQVEVAGDQDGKSGYFRYVDASVGSRQAFKKLFATEPQSRYLVNWEDISTPSDRQHWVAASRWTITDLKTGELMAERIGYAIDLAQGNTTYGPTGNVGEPAPPWGRAGNVQYRHSGLANSCPAKNRTFHLDFLRSVLVPVEQEMKVIPRPVR